MDPVPITRKADTLREQIAAALSESGSATVALDEIPVSLDEWRKLARAAARQIGRPVETIARDTRAWAVLRDWPANDEEQAKLDASMSDAMEKISEAYGDAHRPRPTLVPSPGASSRT